MLFPKNYDALNSILCYYLIDDHFQTVKDDGSKVRS